MSNGSKINKVLKESIEVVDAEHMLINAEHHIEKLKCKLKEKEAEVNEHVKRWQFYEQIVKSLTTFK